MNNLQQQESFFIDIKYSEKFQKTIEKFPSRSYFLLESFYVNLYYFVFIRT